MVDVNPAPRPAPALSATTDMPQVTPPPKPAETPSPDPVVQTVGEALGKKMPADDVKPADPPAGDEPKADATPPAEPEPKGDESPKPDPAISPTERALKGEITKANNRRAAAEARAATAEANAQAQQERLDTALKAIEKLSGEGAAAAAKAQQAADPRPKRETFDNPDAYESALIEWSTRQATAAAKAEFQEQAQREKQEADAKTKKETEERTQREQREAFNKVRETYQERRTKAIEKYPDFEAVAESQDIPVSIPMAHAMMLAENGPEIAYHLGKNPEIAKEISSIVMPGQFFPPGHPQAGQPVPDVTRQFFRMGEIAAQLKAAARPTASKAPPPIKQIGSQAAAAPKTLDEMSGDEYYNATKNEPRHQRRRAGPLSAN